MVAPDVICGLSWFHPMGRGGGVRTCSELGQRLHRLSGPHLLAAGETLPKRWRGLLHGSVLAVLTEEVYFSLTAAVLEIGIDNKAHSKR